MAEPKGEKQQWRGPWGMNVADIVVLVLSAALIVFVIAGAASERRGGARSPGSVPVGGTSVPGRTR